MEVKLLSWLDMELLQREAFGNSVQKWAVFLGFSLMLIPALKIALKILKKQLRRFSSQSKAIWDSALEEALGGTRFWFLVVLAFHIGSQTLTLPPKAEKLVSLILFASLFVQCAIWGIRFINGWLNRYATQAGAEDASRLTTVHAIGFLVKLVFFLLLSLWTLDNFGINITTFVAGLGIGGVAVALAVQNILGDLFASLTIVLDKPFAVGDSITVGDVSGTIENIGLKTTRVRGPAGEQIILPNSNLLQSRIHNFKRMQERTVVFKFGLIYETPPALLSEVPKIVRQSIEAQGNTRFQRAHLVSFGDSALNHEVRYTVLSADYDTYMNIQNNINLALLQEFAAKKIDFAYPTQVVYNKN